MKLCVLLNLEFSWARCFYVTCLTVLKHARGTLDAFVTVRKDVAVENAAKSTLPEPEHWLTVSCPSYWHVLSESSNKILSLSVYRCSCIVVVTGEDGVWGIDFNAQLVQRHVYLLQRSSVLDSLVGNKPLKVTDDGWAMLWVDILWKSCDLRQH